MITQRLQGWARGIARKVAQIFTGLPFITPNVLTLFGFVLNAIVAYLLATQHLVWGGVMMLFAGLFDMLDGALAKITNQVTDFGGFLDSVVDRYSEAVILFGMLLYYYQEPNNKGLVEIILLYTILVGSMMISYARSRAGMLGIANEVGLLARPERIILLGIGLLAPTILLDPVLWILAIGTQITAIQRIFYVYQVTHRKNQPK
jgi:CDP-diacylglycerol---glycerol-3-phosphate 3-phosphatidyltransferase